MSLGFRAAYVNMKFEFDMAILKNRGATGWPTSSLALYNNRLIFS
jgi:hypothetical protein